MALGLVAVGLGAFAAGVAAAVIVIAYFEDRWDRQSNAAWVDENLPLAALPTQASDSPEKTT